MKCGGLISNSFPRNPQEKAGNEERRRRNSYCVDTRRWSRGTKTRGQEHKKILGQGQSFRGQTLSRPSTRILLAKNQEHRCKCSQNKNKKERKRLQFFFRRSQKKKVFKKILIFQAISKRRKQKRSSQIFREVSGVFQHNFNYSKTSAILEPRTGQFSRT